MQGRIRSMTAFTQGYAHALQRACLGRRAGDHLVHNVRLASSKAKYRHLANVSTTTRLVGNEFTDGGTHTSDGVASAGWRAVARLHPWCNVWTSHHC